MKELADRIALMSEKSRLKKAAALSEQQQKAVDREGRRLALRSAMPEIATFVDSLRARFGEVVVVMAEENGRRVKDVKKLAGLGLGDVQ
jgi:hypothetical protein